MKPRRSSAFATSVAMHTLLAGAVTARTLWALPDPPEPDGFVRIPEYVPIKQDEPIRVQIDPPETRRQPATPSGGGSPEIARLTSEAATTSPSEFHQPTEISDEVSVGGEPEETGPASAFAVGPGTPGHGAGTHVGPGVSTGPISSHTVGVLPPVVLSAPDPLYPNAARMVRQQGIVHLEAIIGADGAVRDVRVVRGVFPLLDRAAVDAVLKWRYRPATIDGRPVSVYLDVVVTFSLR